MLEILILDRTNIIHYFQKSKQLNIVWHHAKMKIASSLLAFHRSPSLNYKIYEKRKKKTLLEHNEVFKCVHYNIQ